MTNNIKLASSIIWRQVASLFFLLLLISAIVSFFFGERVDAFIILSIMFINTLLGFFQEFRASKAGEKLLHLVQAKVFVFRGGILSQIPVSELILGDIVHLVAGSVAPVDIQVVEAENAYIDDSMRTGESEAKEVKMGENVFSGAIVSGGKIVGNVIAMGENSSISKYKSKLESLKKWSSFSVFTEKVIKYVFVVSLVSLLIALFFLVFVMGKYSLISAFVFAIAMLVGVVPEMLPLIIMIILTRESLALAKEKVIVKRLSSLSSLGAVQFLLTDKTGTITENKLKVAFVSDVDNFWEFSNSVSSGEYERSLMDSAYDEALEKSISRINTHTKKITHFEPFDRALGYETFTLEGGEKVARGIIQNVLALMDKSLQSSKSKSILQSALEYEKRGMRVSALSYGVAGEWKFSGFVAYQDPIKSTALSSLKIAHDRGVSVKILTGDTALVAMSVAEELHLIKSPENIVSLDAINVKDLTDKQLLRSVVFAKCTPENKLELMDRFLKLGPVAFLGDGINDALALKRADIGIAVDNASDIAKESADVILLEKDLSPVLSSISMGRKALRNILTYIMYTLSGNAGTFFSLLIASFFYPVLPMLPIQILLNNLLTDLPLMLIITDNPDEYALRHVPHFEPKNIMKRVFAFGLISSVFDLIYFQLYKNASVAEFQTGWFILSILAELALIISIRSSRSIFKSPSMSVPLVLGVSASLVLPFIFVYTETLSKVFKFAQVPFKTVIILLLMTVLYIVTNEVAKYFMRRKNLYNKPALPQPIFK